MKANLYVRAHVPEGGMLAYQVCKAEDVGAIGVFTQDVIKSQLADPLEQLNKYLDQVKAKYQWYADVNNQYMADPLESQIKSIESAIADVKALMGTTSCSACDCTGDVVSAVGESLGQCQHCKPNDTWTENVEYLLSKCKHTIRVREGGGPESLLDSLIATFMGMQQKLEALNGK